MVTISPCETLKAQKLFEEIPEIVHAQDPYFVPPFPGTVASFLGEKSTFKDHGTIQGFIAYKDGAPAGRIAAIINRTHNEYYKDHTGFFGFFNFIDDEEVSQKLFEAAVGFLKNHQMTEVRGPYNPSVHDEVGLLCEGFDSSPMMLMPYNPSYYLTHYEKQGLQAKRTLFAYYMSSSIPTPERIQKICDRVVKRTGITIREVELKNIQREMKIIAKLINLTLDRNWGHIPISMGDIEHAANEFKPIIDPSILLIAEKDGEPVGFTLTAPNINELLWKTRGLPKFLRVLKFIWLLKTQRPKELRLFALGVHPDYRRSGLDAVFFHETRRRAQKKYIGGEMSWVDETNQTIMKSIGAMGGEPYKKYYIYQKEIAS